MRETAEARKERIANIIELIRHLVEKGHTLEEAKEIVYSAMER